MKKMFFLVILLSFIASGAIAHSGRTDKCGGHYNRKTGAYHVHDWSKYQACNPQKSEQKNESTSKKVSDDDVKTLIIKESINSYPGSCPCPYNSARNGSRCGKRSAWSRAGGYSPLCYPADVNDDMVRKYRNKHGL